MKDRAVRTLEWAKRHLGLLAIARENLSLGRAWLLEAQQKGTGDTTKASEFLQRAVEGLRQAGDSPALPRGLLARAELHRFNGDYERSERDLAEVLRIATRGGMGLHVADYHLESARLQLAQDNRDRAREHFTTAKEMIERMGYHRRDKEVDELEQQLARIVTEPRAAALGSVPEPRAAEARVQSTNSSWVLMAEQKTRLKSVL